jgi:hypothetical protein
MEQDELLKRVLMMQHLQGMGTEPISAEDPYASMGKDRLILMIHWTPRRRLRPYRTERNTRSKSISFLPTFIETCKMCGVSTLEYFKEFFNAAIKRKQLQMHLKMLSESSFGFIKGNYAWKN